MWNGHFYILSLSYGNNRLTERNLDYTLINANTNVPEYMYPLVNFAKTDNSIDIRFGYFRDLDDGLVQSVFQTLNLLLQKFYRWGRTRFCRRRYSATRDTQLQMLTWLYDRFITTTSFLNIQLRSVYASGLKCNLIENRTFLRWNMFRSLFIYNAKLKCKILVPIFHQWEDI